VYVMKMSNIIFALVKALICLAFVFVLVFSPPPAAHAASGIHSGHHAVTADYEPSDVSYTHSELTITCLPNKFGETSKSDPQNQSSGPCCSGICLSVAVDKLTINSVRQVSNSVYPNFNSQLNSLELFGFLRPPQSLI
jgi:hypothetical protein